MGDFQSAALFGQQALNESPLDQRLQQNLRWYLSKLSGFAYVTLLSDDSYINGVVVLDQSLKLVGSKYLLYCIVTPNVSPENIEVLKRLDIQIILREPILCPQQENTFEQSGDPSLESRWHKAMTKLSIFELEQFSKIVFIDADIIVKQNIDELFSKPHMSACWDGGLDLDRAGFSGSFNSGLMVVEPSEKLYLEIIQSLNNLDRSQTFVHDQLVLQQFFSDWPKKESLHLSRWYAPWTTNFNPGYEHYYYYLRGNIKTLHMIDKKPWTVNKQYFADLMSLYPFYSQLNLEYIEILNYTIAQLSAQGITSSDLKIIE